tara:strand:- start:4445 stop:4654 length:210 start_codon:yes stop_codon:yes gene_type:complete
MKEIIKLLKEDKILRLTVVITLAIVAFIVGSCLFNPLLLLWALIALLSIALVMAIGIAVYAFIDDVFNI